MLCIVVAVQPPIRRNSQNSQKTDKAEVKVLNTAFGESVQVRQSCRVYRCPSSDDSSVNMQALKEACRWFGRQCCTRFQS